MDVLTGDKGHVGRVDASAFNACDLGFGLCSLVFFCYSVAGDQFECAEEGDCDSIPFWKVWLGFSDTKLSTFISRATQ